MAAGIEEKTTTLTIGGELVETGQNQADIIAMTKAVERVRKASKIHAYTDSAYLKTAFLRDYISKWEARNWVTSTGESVKNTRDWRNLAEVIKNHEIEIHFKEKHTYQEWMEWEGKKFLKEIKEEH